VIGDTAIYVPAGAWLQPLAIQTLRAVRVAAEFLF
jgi:hypothetical protein